MRILGLYFVLLLALSSASYSEDEGSVLGSQDLGVVSITYEDTFSGTYPFVDGCHQDQNVLHCQGTVDLIRPWSTIVDWDNTEIQKGFLPLSIPEFDIVNVKAHIDYAQKIPNTFAQSSTSSKIITGTYKRFVLGVQEFEFKNLQTGEISKIKVTPLHKFYVKNRTVLDDMGNQTHYISIKDVTVQHELMSETGDQVALTNCFNNQTKDCGKPLPKIPTKVYNLEVDGDHRYFVGNSKSKSILVHNMKCGDEAGPSSAPDPAEEGDEAGPSSAPDPEEEVTEDPISMEPITSNIEHTSVRLINGRTPSALYLRSNLAAMFKETFLRGYDEYQRLMARGYIVDPLTRDKVVFFRDSQGVRQPIEAVLGVRNYQIETDPFNAPGVFTLHKLPVMLAEGELKDSFFVKMHTVKNEDGTTSQFPATVSKKSMLNIVDLGKDEVLGRVGIFTKPGDVRAFRYIDKSPYSRRQTQLRFEPLR